MDISALDNQYEQKKARLLAQFSAIASSDTQAVSLQKNTSNLFRNRTLKKNKIDVRNFNKVISIDVDNLIAEIEGMTTYEEIIKETLKVGCLPTVVPELKSITIGGALAGVGIESSSFRYGLVHETILEYEILLGDGRIVLCRPDNEHQDLYYAFPNTYGTLGYALKVKVKLIQAKKYVKLTHMSFNNPNDYFLAFQQFCSENKPEGTVSYIDGVVFNKEKLYITVGEFVDEAPFVSNYQYMNIYYHSIERKKTDYLTTMDYIWRWDIDWFWCSKHFLMQNFLLRALLGKWMLKSTVYWKLMNFFNKNKIARYFASLIKGPSESIIQDIEVPIEEAQKFLGFFQSEINIKPIWICPIMPYKKDIQYSFYKMDPTKLYINFGFWDWVRSHKPDGFYNRKIEQEVEKLSGNKSLYSSSYYTPEEFWGIYDKNLYSALKQKYDSRHALSNLYQKCVEKQ